MNPFKNAKIVGHSIENAVYVRQVEGVKRGDKEFVMSRSELMLFRECPSKWIKGFRDNEGTKSTAWGSLVDCLFLTPQNFEKQFVLQPETYSKKVMECPKCKSQTDSKSCSKCKVDRVEIEIQKEWSNQSATCAEWAEKQNGKQIVTKADYESAKVALHELSLSEEIISATFKAQTQVLIVGTYEDLETGLSIPVKCLLDIAPSKASKFADCLFDFKTSRSANPKTWNRHCFDQDYHVQAAFHLDMFNAATGEDRNTFAHIVQENFDPYEAMAPLPILSSEFLDIGRYKYLSALRKYAWCLHKNEWPSYEPLRDQFTGFQIVHPEPWMNDAADHAPELPKLQKIDTELSTLN